MNNRKIHPTNLLLEVAPGWRNWQTQRTQNRLRQYPVTTQTIQNKHLILNPAGQLLLHNSSTFL